MDSIDPRRVCLVCSRINDTVTVTLNAGTTWEDCGHTTADVLALGIQSSLTPAQRWPLVAAVARSALS